MQVIRSHRGYPEQGSHEVRETVAVDTPTAAATDWIVALPRRSCLVFGLSSFMQQPFRKWVYVCNVQ